LAVVEAGDFLTIRSNPEAAVKPAILTIGQTLEAAVKAVIFDHWVKP
jgi:hypothetical protein